MSHFTLVTDRWYAWEMLPGYGDGRYYSPIRVGRVHPLKTGENILQLDFYNAFYAEGVRGFSKDLRILRRGEDYLFADLVESDVAGEKRCVLVAELTYPWLKAHCPGIVSGYSLDLSSGREEIETALESLL